MYLIKKWLGLHVSQFGNPSLAFESPQKKVESTEFEQRKLD